MENAVVVTRIFDASPEQVWQLWTEPELVMQWWGPDRFVCPLAEINFYEGGTSKVCMRAPAQMGGTDTYSLWNYIKIEHLKSIEFIQNLADKNGIKQAPVSLGMPPDFPEDVRTVVSFKEVAPGKTEMTVTEFAEFGQMRMFAQMGLEQCFGKMAEALKNR